MDLHAERFERLGRRPRDPLRETGEDPGIGVQQSQLHLALGIDVLQPVRSEHPGGVVQLGGELDAGRAAADDHDAQLPVPLLHLIVRPQHGVHQPAVEQIRFLGRVERERVLGHARHPERVGKTADRQDQRLVPQRSRRDHLHAALVADRADPDLAPRAVEPLERALREREVMPARLREVVELVLVDVHAARRHLVQQRLPDVRAAAVDERDRGAPHAPEAAAESRRELESAGTAADDDDLMHRSRRPRKL